MESEIVHSGMSKLWQKALEQDLFPGDLMIEIGCFFLGASYQAGPLETAGRETLVAGLAEFDCTTFVETVLALARCAAAEKLSPSEFRKNVRLIRYRQGKIDGYVSRLHYFTDWLRDNENKKVLKNISRLLGGRPHRKTINFMTSHPESYPALKSKTAMDALRQVENRLSRKAFYLIDAKKVDAIKAKIKNGDIIAFATDEEGLDVAHTGFAVWRGRHLYLLHASSKEGQVVISNETLPAYLKSHKKYSGIFVARFG